MRIPSQPSVTVVPDFFFPPQAAACVQKTEHKSRETIVEILRLLNIFILFPPVLEFNRRIRQPFYVETVREYVQQNKRNRRHQIPREKGGIAARVRRKEFLLDCRRDGQLRRIRRKIQCKFQYPAFRQFFCDRL